MVVLEKLIDRHLVDINACTTSLNVLNEGISEDENLCQAQRGLACESWSDTNEDVDDHPVCSHEVDKTTNKVRLETEHFALTLSS